MLDRLDRTQWVTAAEACRLLGRERDYGRLHWLYRKGKLRTRLEISERKYVYSRKEVARVVIDDLQRHAESNETYSTS